MFGSPSLRRVLRRVPFRRETDFQSATNPTQWGNLPASDRPELALPEFGDTRAAKRASGFRFLWLSIAGLAPVVAVVTFTTAAGRPEGGATAAALATLLVASSALSSVGRWWGLLAVPAAAGVAFAVAASNSPLAPAVVAALLAAFAAERFTAQSVHFQSRLPLPSGLGRRYREVWRVRFRAPGVQWRGESYPGLLLTLPTAGLAGAAAVRFGWPVDWPVPLRLLAFAAAYAAFGVALAVAAEHAAARRLGRPAARLGEFARGLNRATRLWLLSGRRGNPAPGLYRAPAGGCSSRRTELFGLVLAGATAAAAVASAPADPIRRTRRDEGGPPPRTEPRPYQRALLDRLSDEDRGRWAGRLDGGSEAVAAGAASPRPAPAARGPVPHALVWFAAVPAGLALSLVPPLACAAGVASRPWPPKGRPGEFLTPQVWNDVVDGIRRSTDRTERESLFMGVNAHDNSPVLMPRSLVNEHVHFLGGTGSGKTSVGIMGLMTQLIRAGDCSVVVLDMKGDDSALLHTARIETEKTGRWFRWVTSTAGRSTYLFNPLDQAFFGAKTPAEKADLITEAANLQYGTTYGPAHFTAANMHALAAAIELTEYENPLRSFRQLEEILRDKSGRLARLSARHRQDALAVHRVISELADPHGLNAVRGARGPGAPPPSAFERAIDCGSLFRSPQTLFFQLPSGDGANTARTTGLLAMHSFFQSAAHLRTDRKVPVYVIIDEFQRIVSPNIEIILEQARSMDIGAVMSHQSMSGLNLGRGVDVGPSVTENTVLRQTFSVRDVRQLREFSDGSGERVFLGRTWNESSTSAGGVTTNRVSRGLAETVGNRISVNDLILMGDRPRRSLFHLSRGEGYAQYGGFSFVIDGSHVITKSEYERRRRLPWPAVSEQTVPAGRRWNRYAPDVSPGAERPSFTGDDLFRDDDGPAAGEAGDDNALPEDDGDPLAGLDDEPRDAPGPEDEDDPAADDGDGPEDL